MESIYDVKRTKVQLDHIKYLKELIKIDLGDVDRKTKEKFKKYIKKELKEAIKYFE